MTPQDVEVTVVVPGDLADEMRVDPFGPMLLDAIAIRDEDEESEDRAYALLAAAVKRAPRPIEVGDTVCEPDGDVSVVLCIDDDMAWVRGTFRGSERVYRLGRELSELTRIDPVPEEAPRG